MNVKDLMNVMESIAPLEFAAEWDNVGLLFGASEWPSDSILLTIDLTRDVLQEALESRVNVIIAYHPPIFTPLRAITDGSEMQQIILEAIRAGIAVYSPHTALDAAPGGVNDWLASAFGEGVSEPLEAHETLPVQEQNKIITMCPADAVSALHQAMSEAGAGVIGNYEQCAFHVKGSGTFFGAEGAAPAIGEQGRIEHVEEVRMEMVCTNRVLGRVIVALRDAHPYEEPPIEIYSLKARPSTTIGQGRIVKLKQPLSLDEIITCLKNHLGVDFLKVAPGKDAPASYRTIGLCAGAGDSLLNAAINEGAELFLTGEMRHHDTLEAVARDCTVILAGHTNTERGYLPTLAKRIVEQLANVKIDISTKDTSPFSIH